MKPILDYHGELRFMSDEVYVITKGKRYVGENYKQGCKVRLISGINGSDQPGYHFSPDYVTVCSVNATVAEFVGLRLDTLKLDKGSRP